MIVKPRRGGAGERASAGRGRADFFREAKRAGLSGDPDPSRSTASPSCFAALCHQTEARLHEEIGAFLDEIGPSRLTLDAHSHVEERLMAKEELTEREERLLVTVRQARGVVEHAVDRVKPRLGSILSGYAETRSAMQQTYRQYWPYRKHFDALVFPELHLDEITYPTGVAGLDLSRLLPSPPALHSTPSVLEHGMKGLPR